MPMTHGVLLSFDNAQTWKKLLDTGADTVNVVDFGPTIAKVERVLYWRNTSGGEWIMSSLDGGLSLYNTPGIAIPSGTIQSIAVDPLVPLTAYIATHTGPGGPAGNGRFDKLYKTTDGGKTLTDITAGVNALPLNGSDTYLRGCSGLAVDPKNSLRVWMTQGKGTVGGTMGIALSTDGGVTWAWKYGPAEVLDHLENLVIDSKDSNIVMVVGREGSPFADPYRIFRTIDGGASWSRLWLTLPATDSIGGKWIARTPSGILIAATYRLGVSLGYSGNNGAAWSNKVAAAMDTPGVPDTTVHYVESNAVGSAFYMSVQAVGLFKSSPLAASWSAVLADADYSGHSIPDPLQPTWVWHCGKRTLSTDGGVFRSTNSGVAWSARRNGGYDGPPFAIGAIKSVG